MAEPAEAHIIDDYETANLNKAAYLMTRGARYLKAEVLDEKQLGKFFLENVNSRHVKEFWDDNLMVEFWSYHRSRQFLKQKLWEIKNNRID